MTNPPIHFVTTTIPYVNGAPHVGHAQEFVLADAVVRHRRRLGYDVRFQSGTDDNSLKNARAAEQLGIGTAELVQRNGARYLALTRELGLCLDDYIQTSSDPRHAPAVHALFKACAASGDIDKRWYRGLYCVGCEQFFADGELQGNICPEHAARLEQVEEENYFFRASRYEKVLYELVQSNTLRIVPDSRKNEVLRFLESGLRDFSISRSRARARGWGISVPDDATQIVYVWFDALANYISALGFSGDTRLFDRYWLGASRRTHVLGKGVLRFHAVHWPVILLSAGLPLPNELLVHGYLTIDGKKIGKSLGNATDAHELVQIGGGDPLRYYVSRHLHTTADADFSTARLLEAHDSELADQLGNLLQRTLALIDRHCGGRVPTPGPLSDQERELRRLGALAHEEQARAFDRFDLNDATAAALRFVAAANRYIDARAPWSLARTGAKEALATVLYELVEALRHAAWLLSPIIPKSAQSIRDRLGIPEQSSLALDGTPCQEVVAPGTLIHSGAPLFPRRAARL
jgi:methionyl-tRNA synthetase